MGVKPRWVIDTKTDDYERSISIEIVSKSVRLLHSLVFLEAGFKPALT